MYHDFCHLKHDPFADTPDPEFLFLSPSHKAALHALISGIEARQELMAIFGAPGLGKTTILRACQARIQPLSQLIFIGYPKLSFRDVLALMYQECGLDCATDSPAAMLSHLYQTWREERKNGWRVVLLIDEAHHLPVQTLESFFHLFVLQMATGENLFQIVLAGLPELQHTLNLPQLRLLRKRLAVRVTLSPLTSEESLAYICHRLTKVLMPEDELFTPGALKRIIRSARGNPRVLNTLCSNMLITGSLRQQKPISAKLAREVIADVETKGPRPYRRWGRAAAVGLLLVVGLLWGWQSQWLGSAKGGPLELSHLAQRIPDLFRGPKAERPLEVPARSLHSELVASPPQAVSEPKLLPELPQAPATTASQERRPPRVPEQEAEERETQAPVVQPKPRQVAPSLSTHEGQKRDPVEVAASLTHNAPVAPLPQAATGPGPPGASAPSIRGLRALDRALLYEPETAVSVGQAPADAPGQAAAGRATNAPPVPPQPTSTLPNLVVSEGQSSPPSGTNRGHAGTTPDRGREITQAKDHSTAATPKVQTVRFHSLPNAATVLINGKVVGDTPVTVQLPMGSHTILVEKKAYTSLRYQLNIDRDGESNLYHNLHEDFRR